MEMFALHYSERDLQLFLGVFESQQQAESAIEELLQQRDDLHPDRFLLVEVSVGQIVEQLI